jgi:hypothetical protein
MRGYKEDKGKTLGAFSPQTPDQRDNHPFGIPSFCRQNVTATDKTLEAFSPQTPDQRDFIPLESLLFADGILLQVCSNIPSAKVIFFVTFFFKKKVMGWWGKAPRS